MSEHTPTPRPWKARKASKPGSVQMYWLVEGKISIGSNNPADAPFVERAVNNHERLVDALKAVQPWLIDARDNFDFEGIDQLTAMQDIGKVIDQARAALAAVEEGT